MLGDVMYMQTFRTEPLCCLVVWAVHANFTSASGLLCRVGPQDNLPRAIFMSQNL